MDRIKQVLLVPMLLTVLVATGCKSSDPAPASPTTPTIPTTPATSVLAPDKSNSGSVWQSGEVYNDVAAVGDSTTNKGIRGFLSFDITGIPAGAVIQSAILDLSNYTKFATEADPFAAPNPLGSFQVFAQNYGGMAAGDYGGGTYGTMHNSLSSAGMVAINVKAGIDDARTNGYTHFQVRLQFETVTSDGVAQLARFNLDLAKLTVQSLNP